MTTEIADKILLYDDATEIALRVKLFFDGVGYFSVSGPAAVERRDFWFRREVRWPRWWYGDRNLDQALGAALTYYRQEQPRALTRHERAHADIATVEMIASELATVEQELRGAIG